MKTILVPTHGEFKRLEEMESRHSYSREEAKRPELVRAFVVGNKCSKRIYVDLEYLIDCLKFGYLNFMDGFGQFIHARNRAHRFPRSI